MSYPVAGDPVLEETMAYHELAAKNCNAEAQFYRTWKNRLGQIMELNDPAEMKIFILLAYQEARDLEEYEMERATYHRSMLSHFKNILEMGFGDPEFSTHPSRHEFGL